MRKITTKIFIDRAKEKWGDKYDYSEVVYVNMKTKIKVICNNKHKFSVTPDNLLRGRGCPYCSGRNDLVNNLNKFINKANKIHNNKYLYHKFEYIDNKTKSIIICPTHGDFKQTTNSHLSGNGCRKCYNNSLVGNLIDFISKSNKIHEGFYSYKKSDYKNSKSNVIITCPKHGDFKQTPSVHLSGSGCKKCMIDRFRINYDDFITKANKTHNNFYRYDKQSYYDMRTKMIVYCPKHGSFEITPDNHISKKQGCTSCSNNVSKSEINWLDKLGINEDNRQYKIENFKVDGFDPNTNTIYEFYGDFWHGNPKKYKPDDINQVNNTTFGELYKKTIEREEYLKSLGYKIVSIWESEYKNI